MTGSFLALMLLLSVHRGQGQPHHLLWLPLEPRKRLKKRKVPMNLPLLSAQSLSSHHQ